MGAQVIAIGDSSGYLAVPRLSMTALKALLHTPLDAVAPEHYCREPEGLWPIPADVVLLCDRDFSLDEAHAKALVAAGRSAVAEGAALTCTPKARQVLESGGALVCPGAAAGAGAALLRSLDTQLTAWEADKRLRAAMRALFQALHTAYPADLTRAAHLTAVRRLQGALHAYGGL
jgi:glutamate dehydrogenase (NADP+)